MKILTKISQLIFPTLLFMALASYGMPLTGCGHKQEERQANVIQTGDSIYLADPTIFYHEGTYYLYGTGGRKGFLVYTSPDMKTWKGPAGVKEGYALFEGDAYGTSGFWAPQVFYKDGKFYMAYTANEHIAIAESDSPLGPFKQQVIKAVSGTSRQIDPFVFIDDDGKKYLYHVRVNDGNRIFIAELKDDLSDIKPGTAKECIYATEPWENTAHASWPVTEGPTVLKHKNLYYLFYSANDFRNIDYAVGYATSPTPYGPWKKFSGNPIISRQNTGHNGTGHGDFIRDEQGNLWYVLHTHHSNSRVSPRLTAIVKAHFIEDGSKPDKVVIESGSFHYLRSH